MSDLNPKTSPVGNPLDRLFSPKSVAVIGATGRPGTVGRTTLENLRAGAFHGEVFAVDPNHAEVLGIRAYAKIGDIPQKIDLAVVVTPAPTVPGILGDCVNAGVRAFRSFAHT